MVVDIVGMRESFQLLLSLSSSQSWYPTPVVFLVDLSDHLPEYSNDCLPEYLQLFC